MATSADVATSITTKVNNGLGLTYDTSHGASRYTFTNPFGTSYFMGSLFQQYLNKQPSPGPVVNCTDCAAIVVHFVTALGVPLYATRLCPPPSTNGFTVTYILPIGAIVWWYPFPPNNSFSYHEVAMAWAYSIPYGGIFDACLQVDSSGDPWNNSQGNPVAALPTDMPFTSVALGYAPSLPIPVPYTAQTYRERLAQNTSAGIGSCRNTGPVGGSNNGCRFPI